MSPVGKVEFTDQAVVVIRVLVSMAKGKKSIICYAAVVRTNQSIIISVKPLKQYLINIQ